MKNAGKDFKMDDATILKIDSPRHSVSGPYALVYKDTEARWAIVALGWGEEEAPRLGMRWFWDNGGNPVSHGYATWLMIPDLLTGGILSSLPIDPGFRGRLEEFLRKGVS